MVKVMIETDGLNRTQLVAMLLEKDKYILKLENIRDTCLEIYEKHKVSDTSKINNDNIKQFVREIETVLSKVVSRII